MKKLLQVMAIALFISGCESSVNLPNINTSNAALQDKQARPFAEKTELEYIGLISVMTQTYSETCPKKIASKWEKLDQDVLKIISNMNEYEQRYVKDYSLIQLVRPYLIENNIPLVPENIVKLPKMADSDPKLKKAILNSSKKNVDAAGFNCVSLFGLVDQKLKSIMAGQIH